MNQIVRNLLAEAEPTRRVCTVIRPLPGGRYQVEDDLGGRFTVDPQAGQSWQPKQRVLVAAGKIVGSAGKARKPNVTEV